LNDRFRITDLEKANTKHDCARSAGSSRKKRTKQCDDEVINSHSVNYSIDLFSSHAHARTHKQRRRQHSAAAPAAQHIARRPPSVRVFAHGHGGGAAAGTATELKKQGFIGEMRAVAMKLHTREQAPKEGEAPSKPMKAVRFFFLRCVFLCLSTLACASTA
jgi:hypothetical protein